MNFIEKHFEANILLDHGMGYSVLQRTV